MQDEQPIERVSGRNHNGRWQFTIPYTSRSGVTARADLPVVNREATAALPARR